MITKTIDDLGRVQIPAEIRAKTRLWPYSTCQMEVEGGRLIITPYDSNAISQEAYLLLFHSIKYSVSDKCGLAVYDCYKKQRHWTGACSANAPEYVPSEWMEIKSSDPNPMIKIADKQDYVVALFNTETGDHIGYVYLENLSDVAAKQWLSMFRRIAQNLLMNY